MVQGSEELSDRVWTRGLLTGHDYILTEKELLDVKLVSGPTMVGIVAIIILASLLIGGIVAVSAFFVPIVIAPPIVELLAYLRRRKYMRNANSSLSILGRRINRIEWSTVEKVKFEGGVFTLSMTSDKRFRGQVRFAEVRDMANYIHSIGRVSDITVRKVDWSYAYGSFFLAVALFFLLSYTPALIFQMLIAASISMMAIFLVRLYRQRPITIR